MAKIQAFIASIMCGFSTFSIMPTTNYFRSIPPDAASITNAAWNDTGKHLNAAIYKIGVERNGKTKNSK